MRVRELIERLEKHRLDPNLDGEAVAEIIEILEGWEHEHPGD